MNTYPASLREIESRPCPGYRSPVTGVLYHKEGQTHVLGNTRTGVRCVSCGVDEPTLRTEAETARRPKQLSDLPIFGWAWGGDAKDVER